MKITFVGGFGFRPKGTIQGRAFPLAAELVRQGHSVTIIVAPYDNLEESGKEWEEEGVRIRGIKSGRSRLSYPALLTRLLGYLEKDETDLVHIFKPKGFAGAAAAYLRIRGHKNLVLDCDDWEGWGGFNDIKQYPWLLKEYIDRQERAMMRSTPAVTVASKALLDRVREVRGSSEGVYYVPNCGASAGNSRAHVDVRSQTPEETKRSMGLDPKQPVIFYNGHFEPGDDIMLFCRMAAPVATRNGAALLFVGEGPDLDKVKKYFADRSEVTAHFWPRLPYDQFIRAIWASDVTAFPYPDNPIHRSKCSLRVIDYMAMGKPVITSAVGQNKEYIVDGESGILAAAEDEAGFAEKLDLLLRDSELRARLGQNAQLRRREKFSWTGEPIRECLAAYEQILNG